MFCRQCGKNIHAEDRFCVTCGAGQASDTNTAPDNSHAEHAPVAATYSEVVTESWKERFALIEKAGGPDLDCVRDLPYWQRRRILFNAWAFLLGLLYYLFLGMWKKAIVLALLCIVGSIILTAILGAMGVPARAVELLSWIVPASVFSYRANIDYYKKVVLSQNGWL